MGKNIGAGVEMNYKAMLVKYYSLICEREGYSFLDEIDWTPEEWEAWDEIDGEACKEANKLDKAS